MAFLLGTWEGDGVVGYPTMGEDVPFRQQVVFGHLGKPVLSYRSQTWDARTGAPLAAESGWWRPQPDGGIEVVLAHPTGIVEIDVGTVTGTRIELVSDLMARTATAREVAAGKRLYGLVEGALLYAVDLAMMGHPLAPHFSARLERVSG